MPPVKGVRGRNNGWRRLPPRRSLGDERGPREHAGLDEQRGAGVRMENALPVHLRVRNVVQPRWWRWLGGTGRASFCSAPQAFSFTVSSHFLRGWPVLWRRERTLSGQGASTWRSRTSAWRTMRRTSLTSGRQMAHASATSKQRCRCGGRCLWDRRLRASLSALGQKDSRLCCVRREQSSRCWPWNLMRPLGIEVLLPKLGIKLLLLLPCALTPLLDEL